MTCRHYRFQIPQEDADELRAADPEPCPVCDNLPHRQSRMIIWDSKPARIRPTSSPKTVSDWWRQLFSLGHEPAHPLTVRS